MEKGHKSTSLGSRNSVQELPYFGEVAVFYLVPEYIFTGLWLLCLYENVQRLFTVNVAMIICVFE